jgi:pimeloyl-ACP methyl ester carboxylesterase
MRIILATFLSFAFLISTSGQDIAGKWNGILTGPGGKLRLVFNIESTDEGYKATLDSPDQGATGLAVSSVEFDNPKLVMKMPQLGASYEGELGEDNIITGTFKQMGQSFPLDLSQEIIEKPEMKRPQEPVAPFPYDQEDVSYPSENGEFNLAGTLTIPKDVKNPPVAILITGSGAQNRDQELMGHKPFWVLADHLTRKGIAVLRYDDRGFAESGGDFSTATSADFASDVKAAMAYLSTRKEFSKSQIGLIGHSEGGLIAPMVAAASDQVDYIVMLAGPGIPGDEILIKQTEIMGKAQGMSEADLAQELALSQKIFDMVEQAEDMEILKKDLRQLMEEALENDNNIPEGMDTESIINMQIRRLATPWYKYFISYDPVTSLEKVSCPVLAINGEKDVQVTPENLPIIKDALAKGGNTQVETKAFPNLNHLFQESETGMVAEYAQIEQTFAPEALEAVSEWVLKTCKIE